MSGSGTVALCLAGGGPAGTFFELGAVAGLQSVLAGWPPRDSRAIVGTSCGAIVGALLALGMDPAETPRILRERNHPLRPSASRFSRLPWRDHLAGWTRAAAALPRVARGRRGEGPPSWADVALELHRLLPPGVFSNAGIETFLQQAARRLGASDRFEALPVPLLVTALDLDRGERVVFGPGHEQAPSVSRAVRASTAIPAYYEPVRIGERDLVDGQIVDPIHLDLAAASGARVILGVSPLTPYRRPAQANGENPSGEENAERVPAREDRRPSAFRVRDAGAAAALEQTARVSAAIKLRASLERVRKEHPGTAVLLVEASTEEAGRLLTASTRPASLAAVWKLGWEAARRAVGAQPDAWTAALEPAGIRVDRQAAGNGT